jgi:hypothetical protein
MLSRRVLLVLAVLVTLCIVAAPRVARARGAEPAPGPATTPTAGALFRVTLAPGAADGPRSGRLIVLLIREGANLDSRDPLDGPFWSDPQPLYGVDVRDLAPGAAATLGDDATSTPVPPSKLPPGKYTAAARLDLARDNSDWKREPGNLYSKPVEFTVAERGAPATVELALTEVVQPRQFPALAGVEIVDIRSVILSSVRGREVRLRAGVIFPKGYDAANAGQGASAPGARRYPAIYEVPGFGGDHTDVFGRLPRMSAARPGSAQALLHEHAFFITLDPEGPNGHTLFADSANNGPVGEALVTELIPELERRFALEARPEARLLRGHSSGGWSVLWLATRYPETFGAAWSTGPDPVDFRRFQLVDIYERANMYRLEEHEFPYPPLTRDIPETPSYRSGPPGAKTVKMTIRQENMGEEVLGPDNTAAQQWDSWMAVFGPRNARGNPAAMYDAVSGAIDRSVARQFKDYDLGALLRADPARYAPIWRQRIRLVCGEEDNFYLEEAVKLLKADLENVPEAPLPEGAHGYIELVPRADHGSVFLAPRVRGFGREMLEHLQRNQLLPTGIQLPPPAAREGDAAPAAGEGN